MTKRSALLKSFFASAASRVSAQGGNWKEALGEKALRFGL
jgi:hypothetical protein